MLSASLRKIFNGLQIGDIPTQKEKKFMAMIMLLFHDFPKDTILMRITGRSRTLLYIYGDPDRTACS
jgi:hypothetical protein